MICIYLPEINIDTISYKVTGEEYTHLRAFRANIGDMVLITNGLGLLLQAEITGYDKRSYEIQKVSVINNIPFNPNKISIAVGILENRDRFEFALEKSVESGISKFIPLITEFSNKKSINPERLKSKAIAAIKQSNQPYLPLIYNVTTLNELAKRIDEFDSVIVCDGAGEKIDRQNADGKKLILVGPEGGFSISEISLLKGLRNCSFINLGRNILRTETAVAQVLGLLNYFDH